MTDAVNRSGAAAGSPEDDDRDNRRTVTPTPAETEREGGPRTTPAPEETGRGGADGADGAERRVVAPTPPEATDTAAGGAYDETGAAAHTGTPTSGTGAAYTGGTNTRTGGTGTGGTGTGSTGTGSTGTGSTGTGSTGTSSTSTHLLPHDECDKLEARLRHAVAGFVDGPRDAVHEADQVLEEIAGRFTEAVTRRRRTLRMSWQDGKSGGGDDAARTDTEQLRLALRDYRELAERLLHS